MVHIDMCGMAGHGLEDFDEGIHISEFTNEAKIDQKIIFVVTGTHTCEVACITGKPPAGFEALDGLDVLEGLHPRGEIMR